MLLSEILKKSNLEYSSTNEINYQNIDVIDITRDTRQVKKGSLFIAVIGVKVDGHDLINEAIEKGASVIIHSKDIKDIKDNVAYIKVKDTRECMAIIAKTFFNIQDNDLTFLGVTGTNGKTTSTYMMKHILEHAGNKVGLIGTIANYIGDKMIPTNMTTPEAIELFRLIKDMREAGCKYCLMEVSSHASAMGRVEGLNFSRGMFTNLTQDHMDYHKTFENYYNAKFKFIKGSKSTVINCDDKYGKKMLNTLHETTNDNILKNVNYNLEGDAHQVIHQVTHQVIELSTVSKQILAFCTTPKSKKELAVFCGFKDLRNFTLKHINPLLESGQLEMTIPDKPKSRNQKYITVRSE